jgi:hypothetical protein
MLKSTVAIVTTSAITTSEKPIAKRNLLMKLGLDNGATESIASLDGLRGLAVLLVRDCFISVNKPNKK